MIVIVSVLCELRLRFVLMVVFVLVICTRDCACVLRFVLVIVFMFCELYFVFTFCVFIGNTL